MILSFFTKLSWRHPVGCMVCLLLLVASLVMGQEIQEYRGCSDVSAVVALDATRFAAANDETNVIATYVVGRPLPVARLDLTAFLECDPAEPETDIEAVARDGDRIWWLTSHGRSKKGNYRDSRCRLFATDLVMPEVKAGAPAEYPKLVPAGQPYSRLLNDLVEAEPLRFLRLNDAIGLGKTLTKKQREELAPKKKGLNIEGMTYIPGTGVLWIGLRNPLYRDPADGRGKAILIPIVNPKGLMEPNSRARLGTPVLLDLGGRGVRAIETLADGERCLIVAGPVAGEGEFAVYSWPAGQDGAKLVPALAFPDGFKAEALALGPDRQTLWVYSDDGTVLKPVKSADACLPGCYLEGGLCENKFLADPEARTFRMMQVPLKP